MSLDVFIHSIQFRNTYIHNHNTLCHFSPYAFVPLTPKPQAGLSQHFATLQLVRTILDDEGEGGAQGRGRLIVIC